MAEMDNEQASQTPAFCPECGAPIEDGQMFCTECGARLEAPVSTEDTADAEEQPPVEEADASEEPSPDSQAQDAPEADAPAAEEPAFESGEDAALESLAPEAEATAAAPATADKTTVIATEPVAAAETQVIDPQPQQNTSPNAVAAAMPAPAKPRSKTPIIIAGTALVAVAVTAGAFLLFQGGVAGGGDNGAPAAVVIDGTEGEDAQKGASPDRIVVELTQTYTTRFEEVNKVTYPAYLFKFPSNWSIAEENVTVNGERVVLRNQDGVSIAYDGVEQEDGNTRVTLENTVIVADGAFVPDYIQAHDLRYIGPSVVVKGTLAVDGKEQEGTCYALVSERSVRDGDQLNMLAGTPAFDFEYGLMFNCCTSVEPDAQTEQEIIAILASFTHAKGASGSASAPAVKDVTTQGGYILPGSDTRLYSSSELEGFSNYELYLARNEIYARHGRAFENEDLQNYFGAQSWYSATVSAGNFSDSMLNNTEKTNIARIKKIEKARDSSYLGGNSGSSSSASGSYILPSSDSRSYSVRELESLSNYQLYLARNEIYARHGRAFNNSDLRQYFNSQSWYEPTVSAGYFSDAVLNDYERDNIARIKRIEKNRGSSYL